jgi:hypothetical protein
MNSRPLAPFQSSACSAFTATKATLHRPQSSLDRCPMRRSVRSCRRLRRSRRPARAGSSACSRSSQSDCFPCCREELDCQAVVFTALRYGLQSEDPGSVAGWGDSGRSPTAAVHNPARPAFGDGLAATIIGHSTCLSAAATFLAEVAVFSVSALSHWARAAASRWHRAHPAGAPAACSP